MVTGVVSVISEGLQGRGIVALPPDTGRSQNAVARRVEDLDLDPAVVPIPDRYELTMDAWLTSLEHDEPIALAASGADLVTTDMNLVNAPGLGISTIHP